MFTSLNYQYIRLYFVQIDSTKFNNRKIACKEYRTLSPDLCVMHYIVIHPSHYSNPCIGHQSSNVLSRPTNSPQWRKKFDYTSSHLTFSSTLVSVTVPFTKTVTAARAFCITVQLSVWNSLSSVVRQTSSQPQFWRRLKARAAQP